jgi:hypothetical protein
MAALISSTVTGILAYPRLDASEGAEDGAVHRLRATRGPCQDWHGRLRPVGGPAGV